MKAQTMAAETGAGVAFSLKSGLLGALYSSSGSAVTRRFIDYSTTPNLTDVHVKPTP